MFYKYKTNDTFDTRQEITMEKPNIVNFSLPNRF